MWRNENKEKKKHGKVREEETTADDIVSSL